jgi:allantoate deiminase
MLSGLEEAAHREDLASLAEEVLRRCEEASSFTEEAGRITRRFLSEPMRRLLGRFTDWMEVAGLQVRVDPAGNLIGHYEGTVAESPVLVIGSHLDTVPDAGKYDGVLGVLLGLAAVQSLRSRRLPFGVDVIGFSEEEGIRYSAAYLGSLAVCGRFDRALLERTDAGGTSMREAFRTFGLDPGRIEEAAYGDGRILGYLEPHIEQGPVLEALSAPVGVVEVIAGQSRLWVEFRGQAGHAGTLPMEMRRDALTAAAEFVLEVEGRARATEGLRATVGVLTVAPSAVNVVPGITRLSLDIRHARDEIRTAAVGELLARARTIATRRDVGFEIVREEHHQAVPSNARLTEWLAQAIAATGHVPHRLVSGAGHDAAVMATAAPMTMLFLRSPGGVSHHPDERVSPGDVLVALEVTSRFLDLLSHHEDIQTECRQRDPSGRWSSGESPVL